MDLPSCSLGNIRSACPFVQAVKKRKREMLIISLKVNEKERTIPSFVRSRFSRSFEFAKNKKMRVLMTKFSQSKMLLLPSDCLNKNFEYLDKKTK